MKTKRAFTLIEIMIVVVIIGIIAGFAVAVLPDTLRRSDATANARAVVTARTAVELYYASPLYASALPLTEPASAVPGNPTYASMATLDLVLLRTGMLTAPIDWRIPNPEWNYANIGVDYNPATRTFFNSGTYDSSYATKPVPGHLEAAVSNPALAPSAANGLNFRLNHTNDLPGNVTVLYAVLPNVPQKLAVAMAQQVLPADRVPAEGLACDVGPIAYAAPSAGVTTVYLYVTHR